MSAIGEALKALRTVLMLQEDIRVLKETAQSQGDRLSRLAEAHADLRERVSRLEGVVEMATMVGRQRRIGE